MHVRRVFALGNLRASTLIDQPEMPPMGERHPIKCLLVELEDREQERRILNAVDRVRLASVKE